MSVAALPLHQWAALAAAAVATILTVNVAEHGRWRVGLAAPPGVAVRELLIGALAAVALIAVCDGLIVATTELRHVRGTGFPWPELFAVYLPAAFHEELLFRGYSYQKVRGESRAGAIVFSSVVFAALHIGNAGITPLAVANLILAGVMLALAYEMFRRLWFPIGLHGAWNVLSGPILGYNVSGYVARRTVLRIGGGGPQLLTGGKFGIEASVWMVAVEVAAIAILIRRIQNEET